jgi:glycine/D-amino acid oxidase-like deaminating enzyme
VRSLWLEEALARERAELRILEGAQRADVCIVGGGYTGLSTAIRLKEQRPALDVCLAEADIDASSRFNRAFRIPSQGFWKP